MQKMWTTQPFHAKHAHTHYAALLFCAICSSTGQRLGDFAHCQWADFKVHYLEKERKRLLMISPNTSKTNPEGTRNQNMTILALEQEDIFLCPIRAFEKVKDKLDQTTYGQANCQTLFYIKLIQLTNSPQDHSLPRHRHRQTLEPSSMPWFGFGRKQPLA